MKSRIPSKILSVFHLITLFSLANLWLLGQDHQRQGATSSETRSHRRVAQMPIKGRRVELSSLKGAQLFIGPFVDTERPVPLIIHFHGAAWLIETHISRSVNAALITVNLGAGSSVYGRPFEQENVFSDLLAEAERELPLRRGWKSITLTGFSAGYGAIRAILRNNANFRLVNNVLLLDGIHADLLPEGVRIIDGGMIDDVDPDAFVMFAAEAARGKKNFVITHSEIVPDGYASTTECTDYLFEKLKLKRKMLTRNGPGGMVQLSSADKKGFHVRGYAGDTAQDHVDHLHEMPEWLGFPGLRHR